MSTNSSKSYWHAKLLSRLLWNKKSPGLLRKPQKLRILLGFDFQPESSIVRCHQNSEDLLLPSSALFVPTLVSPKHNLSVYYQNTLLKYQLFEHTFDGKTLLLPPEPCSSSFSFSIRTIRTCIEVSKQAYTNDIPKCRRDHVQIPPTERPTKTTLTWTTENIPNVLPMPPQPSHGFARTWIVNGQLVPPWCNRPPALYPQHSKIDDQIALHSWQADLHFGAAKTFAHSNSITIVLNTKPEIWWFVLTCPQARLCQHRPYKHY